MTERLAIIGFGAIGRTLLDLLAESPAKAATVVAIVERPEAMAQAHAHVQGTSIRLCTGVQDALGLEPTLFVECAGHAGLRAHAHAVLGTGVDLLVASVGALSDAALEAQLRRAAEASGAKVLLPAGAIGGLDVLAAARYAGLEEVAYTSVKAVKSWRGTHAETLLELDKVDRPVEFFTGNARDAARLFPQNANVAAAVALAGIGFERTRVILTADPKATGNRHRIVAKGPFGSIDVTVEGRPLPANPKTSMLAPMSILRAIESRSAALRFI